MKAWELRRRANAWNVSFHSNLFTVANSHYKPSWLNQVILQYSPPRQQHSFYWNLPPLSTYLPSVINPAISNRTGSNTNLYNETRRNSWWNWLCSFLVKDRKSGSKHWIVWLKHYQANQAIFVSQQICLISQCADHFVFYAMLNIRFQRQCAWSIHLVS